MIQRRKVAIVFGGRSPIALACARHIALSQRVILVTRRIDIDLLKHIEGSNIQAVEANLESPGESSKVLASVFELGFEPNAVAFLQRYKPDRAAHFNHHATVELGSIVEVLEGISEKKNGEHVVRILISSSPAAHQVLLDQDISYHIVKAGQEAIVRYYASKLARRRILVNAVRIGSVVIKPRSADYWKSVPKVVSALTNLTAEGRLLTSDDVGRLFADLATSLSQSITGQTFTIDNGFAQLDSAQVARTVLTRIG
jgi:NAD(P)-dependent dehydrogenase (short-subunit alcohol dehydrogenase family)